MDPDCGTGVHTKASTPAKRRISLSYKKAYGM
jgi:hypothetical protein